MLTDIQATTPPAAEAAAGDATPPRMGRRLIVDQHRALAGYQLTSATVGRVARSPGLATVQADPPELTRPTFVRCSCKDIDEGLIDALDARRVVLEITDTIDDPAMNLAVLKAARGEGFRLAFDTRLLKREYAELVPLANYIVMDMGALELDRAAAVARGIQAKTQASVVASRVWTDAQFERMAEAGVKLFEGQWFAQPPEYADSRIQHSQAAVIQLLNMVVREADVGEIEALLKREPTLAYRLLRHINSAGFGHRVEITSFRHAVMTVGMKRLFRWAVLLMAHATPGGAAPAAGTLAVVRGRLMELLVADASPPGDADLAFVIGMFSMMDTLLGMPLSQALALVSLPDAVSAALLRGEGEFVRYVAIARACENADLELLEILASRHRLSYDRILGAHVEALAWFEQLGR